MKCIIVVPIQLIESWLLFQSKEGQLHPENLPRKRAKSLFYGTDKLTAQIQESVIDTKGLPYIQKVDLGELAKHCSSFHFFKNQMTDH